MKTCSALFLLCIIEVLAAFLSDTLAEDCGRPEDLKHKEDSCWTAEIEIVDRVKLTSKSVFNFAKKKLGLEVEEDNQPKKCEYYLCIFQQLQMLNGNNYPVYDNFKKWAERHATYYQVVEFMKQLNKCYDALSNSTAKDIYFDADKIEIPPPMVHEGMTQPQEDKDEPQTKCDLAQQFMKCLSFQEEVWIK